MIPTKNMEWYGFVSEEGENILKEFTKENVLYHFKRNIPHLLFWFSKAIDLEKHC